MKTYFVRKNRKYFIQRIKNLQNFSITYTDRVCKLILNHDYYIRNSCK